MKIAPVYVIDANVFVSDAHPGERFHATSAALFLRIAVEQWQVLVPAIMPAEVAAGIARQTEDAATAQQFVRLLQRLPHIQVVDVDHNLGNLAAGLAAQHRIRGCDAIYVALAQLHNAVLITLDQEQWQRVPPDIVARTPAEELLVLQT